MDEKRQQREFKFRAYDTKNKKWLHEYDTLGGFSLKGETVVFHELWNGLMLSDLLDHVVIMQYTGLKDKHGKDIYEGDIDSHGRHIEYRDGAFHVVQNNGQTFDYLSHMKHIEIIGNIYQRELSES